MFPSFETHHIYKLTSVQATFVLVTFVHMRNISAATDLILIKLLRLLPGISRTDSKHQGDIFQATFDHIRNTSAVTDPILTKL